MTDKNEEFWKELMGEDFKVDVPPASPSPAPEPKDPGQSAPEPRAPGGGSAPLPEPRTGGGDPGFKIEYVSRDGSAVSPGGQGSPRRSDGAENTRQSQGDGSTRQNTGTGDRTRSGGAGSLPRSADTGGLPRSGGAGSTGDARPEGGSGAPSGGSRPRQGGGQGGDRPQPRPSDARRVSPPEEAPRVRRVKQSLDSEPEYGFDGDEEEYYTTPRRGKKRSPADDFEVEYDYDAEYPDVEEKAVKRGRTKRTGCLSGILLAVFVICVSTVLAVMGWTWATDVLGLDGEDVTVEVTLPKSIFHTEEREEEDEEGNTVPVEVNVADMDKVAEELYQKGLIRYKWLFKLFSRFAHGDTKVEAGTYSLNMNYDYRALIHGMSHRTGVRETVDVTIPEGYSITQIVGLMVDNGVCEREELLDVLANQDFDYPFLKDADIPPLGDPKRLEGFLFPDTYQFYVDDDPVSVVRRFLNNFQKKWTEEFDDMAAELGYTRREVLIIASMIEKEAGVDSERDLIASVIFNRLNHPDRQGTNGLLQIDATIYYVIADTNEAFSTELDSPYNTYLYPGLPAGPIANPGVASIRAALNPQETKYYFYALGQNKSHRFFETYEQFTSFVNSDQYGG